MCIYIYIYTFVLCVCTIVFDVFLFESWWYDRWDVISCLAPDHLLALKAWNLIQSPSKTLEYTTWWFSGSPHLGVGQVGSVQLQLGLWRTIYVLREPPSIYHLWYALHQTILDAENAWLPKEHDSQWLILHILVSLRVGCCMEKVENCSSIHWFSSFSHQMAGTCAKP